MATAALINITSRTTMRTETSENKLKNNLKDVDLSGIKIVSSKIHPKSDALYQYAQQKVTEECGPAFKVSKDLAEFTFYTFPLIDSIEIASCVLIYDMCGFLLDDHLDKYPNGEKRNYFAFTNILKFIYL